MAGCAHAATLLAAMAQNTESTTSVAQEVLPRDLMNDTAPNWVGADPRGSRVLATASPEFCKSTLELGLILQLEKSGHLEITPKAAFHFAGLARVLRMAGKRHARYLGRVGIGGIEARAEGQAEADAR